MEKTIGDLARHLKNLIPRNIPETYTVKPMFKDIFEEKDIINGVLAFRNFLYHFCDYIITDNELSIIQKKGKKRFSDETTLTVEFPFISNIKSILMNIGQYGVLSEENSLTVDNWDTLSTKRSYNKNSTAKISTPQMLKSMKFLTKCGVKFDGIDLNNKKTDISSVKDIKISYSADNIMAIGLKVLGIAQNELSTRKNDDILLRCNYRVLQNEDLDISSILNDFINPLTAPLQDFVLAFHKHYIDMGMICNVEQDSLCIHFMYHNKKKFVWRFTTSLHNGYRMVLKTTKTSKYLDIIEKFPKVLRDKINKGYGCDRKEGSSHGNCEKGCEGFCFPLDDSILNISNELELWLDSELQAGRKRK